MHLDAVRLGSALLGRLSVPDTLGLERIGWLEAQVGVGEVCEYALHPEGGQRLQQGGGLRRLLR